MASDGLEKQYPAQSARFKGFLRDWFETAELKSDNRPFQLPLSLDFRT